MPVPVPPASGVPQSAPHRDLIRLALPILLTQSASAGFGLVDTIMAGRVSPADLAAVAIGAGLWLPVFLLISGILVAVTPLISAAVGAQERERIPLLTQQGIWLGTGLGLAGMALLNMAPWLFDLLGVPAHLQAETRLYLLGISLGLPAIGGYAALRGYAEALGQPRIVTLVTLLGLVCNVLFNTILIHGYLGLPALGGAGCGFATALVQWVMLLVLAVYLSRASRFASLRPLYQFSWPVPATIRAILALGLPIGAAIFFETTLFSLASLVLAPLGETVVAAHQVALSVTSQLFMVPLSLGTALTILIGRTYGARDAPGLRHALRAGVHLTAASIVLTVSIILLFRMPIVQAYTTVTAVQALALQLLWLALGYQLSDAIQVAAAGCLRGLQDTRIPMWLTLFSYWVVAFPVGFYLARHTSYGAQGMWAGLVLGLTVAAVLLAWRLRQQTGLYLKHWQG